MRRAAAEARQGGADLRRRSGHEPLHAGFVGHGMLDAACPGQVFTSPTPGPDAGRRRGGRHRRRRPVHRQELRRRRDELRDGAPRWPAARSPTRGHRRRRGGRNSTCSTGRRGVAGTLVVEKIVGAAAEQGRDLAALQALGERGQRAHALHGRGADELHRAGRRQADLRRSARTRWRWASASTASRAGGASARSADAIADGDARRDRRRSRATAAGRSAAARQRLRRHAADGALSRCTTRRERLVARPACASRARWSATTSPRSKWPAARSRVALLDDELNALWDAPVHAPACAGGCRAAATSRFRDTGAGLFTGGCSGTPASNRRSLP